GNQILPNMVINLRSAIDPSRSEHLLSAERRKISLEGHIDIFNAIKSGDPASASAAMTQHLYDIKENVLGAATT
ncbi:MAG: FCD domain-containing protein, partial [Sneathiella sp.]|nr:FCD domain-containing protein [Sneathiella sp.]